LSRTALWLLAPFDGRPFRPGVVVAFGVRVTLGAVRGFSLALDAVDRPSSSPPIEEEGTDSRGEGGAAAGRRRGDAGSDLSRVTGSCVRSWASSA